MNGTWWMTLNAPSDTPVLAFITTIHCSITVLRKYRPRGGSRLLLLPSFFFAASPWFLSTPGWLAAVIVSHVGWFIACEKLIAPPAPAALAPAAARPETKRFHDVPLLGVRDETAEIRTFRFARPAGFAFQPGQFVMVRAEVEGKPLIRCYSLSSSPSTITHLEISVRRQGRMSGYLHANARAGMTLGLSDAGGKFVYPPGDAPIVLLAGGIGITPLLSMLRHALETEPGRPVTLLLSAKSEDHVPFRGVLAALARRHPQFRLAITLSGVCPRGGYFSGRIDRALITRVVARVTEAVYLICGPAAMIEEMRSVLASLGVAAGQVHFERFEAASAGAELRQRSMTAAAEGGNGHGGVCVRLERRGRLIAVGRGQSILEAAEGAGEELPSLCREGVCGTCKVRLTEGKVEGDFDSIDAGERAAGVILACVARPVTNCAVDA